MAQERQDEQQMQLLGMLAQTHAQEQGMRQQELAGLPDERALEFVPPEERGAAYNALLQQRQEVTQRPYRFGPEMQAQLPAVTPQAKRMQAMMKLGTRPQATAQQPPSGDAATPGKGGLNIGGQSFSKHDPEAWQREQARYETAIASRQRRLDTERNPETRAQIAAELEMLHNGLKQKQPFHSLQGPDGLPVPDHPGAPAVDKNEYNRVTKKVAEVMKQAGGLKTEEGKAAWARWIAVNDHPPTDFSSEDALRKADTWANMAGFALTQAMSGDQAKLNEDAKSALLRQANTYYQQIAAVRDPGSRLDAIRVYDEFAKRHPELDLPLYEGGRYSAKQKVKRRVSKGIRLTGSDVPGAKAGASQLPVEREEFGEEEVDETDKEARARQLADWAESHPENPAEQRRFLGAAMKELQEALALETDGPTRDRIIRSLGALWKQSGLPGAHPLEGAKLTGLSQRERETVEHQRKMRNLASRVQTERERHNREMERLKETDTFETMEAAAQRLNQMVRTYTQVLNSPEFKDEDLLDPTDLAAKAEMELMRDEALINYNALMARLKDTKPGVKAPGAPASAPAGPGDAYLDAVWSETHRRYKGEQLKKAKANFFKRFPGYEPPTR